MARFHQAFERLYAAHRIDSELLLGSERWLGAFERQLALAAQVILRHKNLSTTTGFYVKQVPIAGANGLRLLEEKAKGILKAGPADDASAEGVSIDRTQRWSTQNENAENNSP